MSFRTDVCLPHSVCCKTTVVIALAQFHKPSSRTTVASLLRVSDHSRWALDHCTTRQQPLIEIEYLLQIGLAPVLKAQERLFTFVVT